MCYVPLSSILNILCIYRHSPLQIFKYFEIRQFKSEYVMFIAICHLKSLCILPFDTSHLNVQYIAIRQFKSLCILTYANLNLNVLNISTFSNVEATFAEIPGVLETGTIRKIDRRYPFNDACQVSHKSNH